MLPPDYAWFQPVLIASIAVFVISWIGNILIFSNKLLNAIATALVFAAVFGALTYYGYGGINMSVRQTQDSSAPGAKR